MSKDYVSIINSIIDYIQINIGGDLSLDALSKKANVSKYHFHRVFKDIIGENLNEFVCRVRVEKARLGLIMNKKYSITQIAFKCGFSSSQALARAMRKYYNCTPSQIRNSNIGYINSNIGKEFQLQVDYNVKQGRPNITFISINDEIMKVEIKNISKKTLAYVRNIGPYVGDSSVFQKMFTQLCGWAGPRNLLGEGTEFFSLYLDDPKFTDPQKLRLDVAISIDDDISVDGEISKQILEGGMYAVCRFEFKEAKEYPAAWDSLYRDWLPKSGYSVDTDRPAFEQYLNDPKQHPEGIHIVDICIPIKPE